MECGIRNNLIWCFSAFKLLDITDGILFWGYGGQQDSNSKQSNDKYK